MDGSLMVEIMEGLSAWKKRDEWNRDGGRYIPHAATWLHNRRWEDEIQTEGHAPDRKPEASPARRVIAQEYTQRDYYDEDADAFKRMLASAGYGRGE